MPVEELEGLNICKCGNKSYAYRVGWKRPNGKIIHWHKRKDFNHCKECRNKIYKKIERTKKKRRLDALTAI